MGFVVIVLSFTALIPFLLAKAAAAAATADSAAVAGAQDAVAGWVETVLGTLVLVGLLPALWFYGRTAYRIWRNHRGQVDATGFGPSEAGAAAGLTTLLLAVIALGFAATANGPAPEDAKLPEGHAIVLGVLLDTGLKTLLVVALLTGLILRGQRPEGMFGFNCLGLRRVVLSGAGLLLAALPLVYAVAALAQWWTGGAERHGQEEAVRLLASARDPASRLAMIVAAVVVAPVVEEFIFRGYLYGVLRRYLGFGAGLVLNAALFAGIHLHVPSLAPLFVFALCLTLAYERTGSLLVPMAMHALFNALSVALLLLGVSDAG